jgi:hypothetical protein
MSNTRLRLWGDTQVELDTLVNQIAKFVESNEPIAQVWGVCFAQYKSCFERIAQL